MLGAASELAGAPFCVVAADLSWTRTAIVRQLATDTAVETWGTAVDRSLKDQPHGRRLLLFDQFVRQALKRLTPDYQRGVVLYAVEGYAYNRLQSSHILGELGGVYRLAVMKVLGGSQTRVGLAIPPLCIKAFITGDCHSGKDKVVAAVETKLGIVCRTDDEADARALAAFVAACWRKLCQQGDDDDEYVTRFLTNHGMDGTLFS